MIHFARLRRLFLAAALALVASAAMAGIARVDLLDHEGSLYQLRAIPYAEAEPAGILAAPTTTVLVLDKLATDGTFSRQIVPRSLGAENDIEPRLYLEGGPGSLLVVWTISGDLGAEIFLSVFRDGAWVDELSLSGGAAFGRGGLDTLVQTYFSGGDIQPGTLPPRQILHAVWWDDGIGARYVPVLLANDGSIDRASLAIYDPALLVPVPPAESCAFPIPEAAAFPEVDRESVTSAHLVFYSPIHCRYLVVPISRFTAEVTTDADGNLQQTRFIPFIGVAYSIDPHDAQVTDSDGEGDDTAEVISGQRFVSAANGHPFGGYAAASSWVAVWQEAISETEFAERTELRYRLWDPLQASWSDVRRIPITGSLSVQMARDLVQQLLDGR